MSIRDHDRSDLSPLIGRLLAHDIMLALNERDPLIMSLDTEIRSEITDSLVVNKQPVLNEIGKLQTRKQRRLAAQKKRVRPVIR